MDEIVKHTIEKISSYNLFNYLFPGAIFSFLLPKVTHFIIFSPDASWVELLFIWYFIGMVLSRIGSLFIEKQLKDLKIKGKPYIQFSDYSDYITASESDSSIALFSEVNNTYRTIIAMLLSLAVLVLFDAVSSIIPFRIDVCSIPTLLLLLLIAVLFIKSYKKQTDYITQRIEHFKAQQAE